MTAHTSFVAKDLCAAYRTTRNKPVVHMSRHFSHVLPFEISKFRHGCRIEIEFLELRGDAFILLRRQGAFDNFEQNMVFLTDVIAQQVHKPVSEMDKLRSLLCEQRVLDRFDEGAL